MPKVESAAPSVKVTHHLQSFSQWQQQWQEEVSAEVAPVAPLQCTQESHQQWEDAQSQPECALTTKEGEESGLATIPPPGLCEDQPPTSPHQSPKEEIWSDGAPSEAEDSMTRVLQFARRKGVPPAQLGDGDTKETKQARVGTPFEHVVVLV